LFEYAVIRVVPRVEREEFLNIGVVLYCARQKFLSTMFVLDEERLRAFPACPDTRELTEFLNAFAKICKGGEGAGPIGRLTLPERFRWLTATRSTILQTSKVHPGFCADAGAMLEKLYFQLVL